METKENGINACNAGNDKLYYDVNNCNNNNNNMIIIVII